MMSHSNNKWSQLKGGYKTLYNPVPVLKKLEAKIEVKACWKELWEELHHQGDLGDAAYVSLVKLIEIQEKKSFFDWNFYALAATIEIERQRKTNPDIPNWLKADYKKALSKLCRMAAVDLLRTKDPATIKHILSVLAACKKQYLLAAMIAYSDQGEIKEYLNSNLAWGDTYSIKKI